MRIVYSTFSSHEEAARLAREAVEKKVAACVNILPQGTSIYSWEEKVCSETEFYALFKTTEEKYPELETFLLENHSYDCPCIWSVESHSASPDYEKWVSEQLEPSSS